MLFKLHSQRQFIQNTFHSQFFLPAWDGGPSTCDLLLDPIIDLSMRLHVRSSTAYKYSSAVKKYLDWRQALGIQPVDRLSEKQLCKLCWLFVHDRKFSGLSTWLSAIEDFHVKEGWPPLPREKRYERTRKTIKNICGLVDVRTPAVPISKQQLLAIKARLDPKNLVHTMFWLGCLLGFQALLRASEFCKGALDWDHTTVFSAGAKLKVPFSKTKSTPVVVAVATNDKQAEFCIIQAMIDVKLLQKNQLQLVSLSYDIFNKMLKDFYALAVGDPIGISSHSLRRGGATTLVWQGVPDATIMAHGRWTSNTWKDYIDLSAVQQLVAALALHN